ncbi:MAG: class I adenylate-forming enzyme family protein [Jatrophihabitantaceae bacterium]
MTTQQTRDGVAVTDAGWVDEILLAGPDSQLCFASPVPVDRATLRQLVAERRQALAAAGLRPGGAAALRLPPSLAYVANLLATWQLGAQAILLDHRLTDFEVNRATERLSPQVIVSATQIAGGLRIFHEVADVVTGYRDQPAETEHAVIQLSSGSTGPSKIIGRTAADLITEIGRYTQIDGVPLPGERIILLPSMVHVLGLVGGLLYGLHAGVTLVPPERLTGDSILDAVDSDSSPATVLGVPFHISLLTSTVSDRRPAQLRRMTTGGELVPPSTAAAFDAKFGVPLGNMYGMTEVGVIGTDLYGEHRPAIRPAPGIEIRQVDGELHIARPSSPYLGPPVPERWADGWLRTKDAGRIDPATGLVSILGRLDSQVTIGGLQVDLAEVEHTINSLPGVLAAVVVFDSVISAYLELDQAGSVEQVEAGLADRLASYKLPRDYQLLTRLPRTTTGKLVRDRAVLRAAVS